jgi:hypothetical protein
MLARYGSIIGDQLSGNGSGGGARAAAAGHMQPKQQHRSHCQGVRTVTIRSAVSPAACASTASGSNCVDFDTLVAAASTTLTAIKAGVVSVRETIEQVQTNAKATGCRGGGALPCVATSANRTDARAARCCHGSSQPEARCAASLTQRIGASSERARGSIDVGLEVAARFKAKEHGIRSSSCKPSTW